MKKLPKCILAVATVLLLLGILFSCFPVLCGRELPDTYAEAVMDQAKGPYSKKIPLIPVFVRITGFDRETAHYTIYYFPFGSVGMSYHAKDGYNIEKPLSRK